MSKSTQWILLKEPFCKQVPFRKSHDYCIANLNCEDLIRGPCEQAEQGVCCLSTAVLHSFLLSAL